MLRRSWAALLLAALPLAAGCVTTASSLSMSDGPPTGTPVTVLATWLPQVVEPSDALRGGKPFHALAARVYLFGADIKEPIGADGSLLVKMADPIHPDRKFEPCMIDSETLKKLQRRDIFGWGYTVVVPFWDYETNRDVKELTIQVAYIPNSKNAAPVFSDASRVTLGGQGDQPNVKQVSNGMH
jgi:hypothetical protein